MQIKIATKDCGGRGKHGDRGGTCGLTAMSMTGNGQMVSCTAKAHLFGVQASDMMENGNAALKMVRAFSPGPMGQFLMGFGLRDGSMGLGYTVRSSRLR